MKRLLIFLLPIIIFAQTITKVDYKGLIHISPITASTITQITPNSQFDIEKIDKAIKNLYKTGYFEEIKADFSNGVLTFICKEKPTIAKIHLTNVSEDVKKLLKQEMILPKKGELLSKQKLEKLKEFIKQYYTAKGYYNTVVATEIEHLNQNRIVLHIIVNKGKEVYIRNVNFYGTTIPKSDLLDEIENRPRTFWSWIPFTNAGKLKVYDLPKDRQALQDYLLNKGYMDSRVNLPLAKTNLDSYFADIDYQIYQGKRYIVKEIKIDYPKNIKVKLPELKLKKDKYFNVSALRKDLLDISHAFMNEGYAFVKVYPQIKKEKTDVYLTYKVIPGEIVYINNVIISGNNKTLDRVVRRNIYLAPGDKYSYKDMRDSQNALKRTGYLENVKIKMKKISPNKVNLLVNVKEGLSGTLRAGISYGSYTKLGFNLALSEKNVFGSGQSLSINADVSAVNRTYKITLFNPRVLDSKYSLSTSIYDTSFEGISYTSKERGFSIGLGKQLNRFTSASITYGYVRTKLSDYNTTEYIMPKSTKSYITLALGYNDTDDYFFPTTGIKAGISSEFAGIGGDEKFIKTLANFKYFYPLTDKTYQTVAVLKYRVKGGAIAKNGYLPINEKFYLGGTSTVRGFSWYSIAPKDSEGNEIGGKYEFITGAEISTPLSRKNRMWLTGFIDYGAVGEDKLNITRSSYGFQIDWITPMGPLSFIWAWPIKSEKGDDLQRFEFTIGTTF
ncbi:outer membrane protein assembly factor BamA [Caminibacter pacificus]|uniref:Outer membrane protein assembly factor BamA n=1 Tax=Caminibacter pacificus TaxID=1424653 RepID=A0AAJ4UXI7_9BACT|nr:outer membrane protein assembly factor BamA [Caminibacter pacificus]QCI28922.1 outer membrane protein assembly factor BamA [Caminibacter pacificus]ROR39513.1 Beta-barrel assembly machine subunit BamA [Caminibacter pacificus]